MLIISCCWRFPDSSTVEYTQRYLENREEATQPPDAEELHTRIEKYRDVVFAPTAVFVRRYLEPYKQKVVVVRNKAERARLIEILVNR